MPGPGTFEKSILYRNLDDQFVRTGQFYSLARHSGGSTSFEWRSILKKIAVPGARAGDNDREKYVTLS